MTSFTAACIQLTSKTDIAENLSISLELIREASAAGADFIATPEVTNMLEPNKQAAREKAQFEEDDVSLKTYRDLAVTLGKWILAGSLVIKLPGEERLANRSLLIAPDGSVKARYDKIHMFDVELENGEFHRESSGYKPGEQAVLAQTPLGNIGMTVCYDVRFAHLYQDLARAGAGILTIPAAFTYTTGLAHWHILLRARAIENGAFVIAPAQCGQHSQKRRTYGHSLIIDPWGEILADGGEEPGFISARINMDEVAKRRRNIPNLVNIRPYNAANSSSQAAE